MRREAYGEIREVEYIKTIEFNGTKMDIAKVHRIKGQFAYFGYSTESPYDNWLIGLELNSIEDCFKTFVKGRNKEKSLKIKRGSIVEFCNKNLILWRKKIKSI